MRSRLPALALLGTLTIAGAGALAQAEAERRLDAALARLRAALGPETTLTIGTRRVDPVTGQAMLTNVVLASGPNRLTIPELHLADLGETRIGRAELHRASLQGPDGMAGELARALVAGLALPPPGQPFAPETLALAALEIEALRLADGGKSLTLERLTLSEASRNGLARGLVQGFAYRDSAGQQQARIGRVEVVGLVLPFKGDAFDPLVFRAGRIALDQAELRDAAQQVQLSLGRVALENWTPGRPTSLAVAALEMTTPADGSLLGLRLATLEASGIDAARTLQAVMENRQTPDPLPGQPQRAQLAGLDVSLDGVPVVALGRFSTEAALEQGIVSAAMLLDGLRVTPPRGQAEWLEMLGYQAIAGEAEMRAAAPRAGGRLEVAPLRIALQQAGTLALTLRAENMPATPAEGSEIDPMGTLAALAAGQLGQVTLSYRDQGLFGRVLAMQARQQRIPEARLREQWAQMALSMPIPGAEPPPPARGRAGPARPAPQAPAPQGAAPGQPPAKAKIGIAAPPAAAAPAAPAAADGDPFAPMRQALAAFIRQPGTLEITLRPPRPLPFGEMAAMAGEPPGETIRRLGLSVTHR